MSRRTTLTAYASALPASISLFGLVDAGRAHDGTLVAGAITQAHLLPIPGIATATFLALTVIPFSRGDLARPHHWNDGRTGRAVPEIGLAATCHFGVLALLSYIPALMAPSRITGAGPALARPWLLAAPGLGFGIPDLRALFESNLHWLRHYGFAAGDVPSVAAGLSR